MNTEQIIQTLNKLSENITEFKNQMTQYQKQTVIKETQVIPEYLKNIDSLYFSYACGRGELEDVKIMLTMPHIDPAYNKNDPIRKAAEYGHVETVKLLLQDPRVDPSDNEVLKHVLDSKFDNKEIVYMLMKHPKVKAKLGL